MVVYKCDRCGKIYLPKEYEAKYYIQQVNKNYRVFPETLNICESCHADLVAFMKFK